MSGDVMMSHIKHEVEPDHSVTDQLHNYSTVSSVYPPTPGPPPIITQALIHESDSKMKV